MATFTQHMLLRLSFVPAILVFALAFWAVPQFVDVYRSFGADLPRPSAFLVSWYRALAFLPLLFLLAWFFWPQRDRRGVAALAVSVVLSGAIFLFGVWAAYAPILGLGANQ
ncbi:hypothetical protein H0E84_02540 [Luteimonas sp. SJ-92]|uniref:Uncharacterized protein n=1 Tax=Luteimonas salinisoli TaxID=2752307 RepID=A0A853J981_9GAMM|nr:hypothetical protein [Luteimonas salinisoli]NZA25247.1 hypothetical protein [Luteimonas salinisoli]